MGKEVLARVGEGWYVWAKKCWHVWVRVGMCGQKK